MFALKVRASKLLKMKKLKLKMEQLSNAQMLSRDQLKKVMGGTGSTGYEGACRDDSDCPTQNIINACGEVVKNVSGQCYQAADETKQTCHYNTNC